MTTLGQSVRVAVYKQDAEGQLQIVANIPRRRNVQWLNEVNSPGTGQFDMSLDDPILVQNPTMLNYFNIVKFFVGDTAVKAWVIESIQPVQLSQGENADRWITVAGRGPMSCLENAIVYPDYQMSNIFSPDRYFNFSSAANDNWFISGNWVTPAAEAWPGAYRKMPNMTETRTKYKWPDNTANYLWYPYNGTGPTALRSLPPGTVYFRTTFEITSPTPIDIVILATADDKLKGLYFDGQFLTASTGRSAWKTVWRKPLYNVQPGTHVIGAECENLGKVNTPAGYLMACYQLDDEGDRTDNLLINSNTATTLVTESTNNPKPGWQPALVLKQLIQEAQHTQIDLDESSQSTRVVDCLVPVNMDSFTADHDSDNVAWDPVDSLTIKEPIATTDLADIAQQMIELSCDIDFDADFNMYAWKRRGSDVSANVRLVPANNLVAYTAQGQGQRIRNQTIVVYAGAITELYAGNSRTLYGRREVGISVGSTTDGATAAMVGAAALQEIAIPEVSVTTTITSVKGPQPWQDFDLGDTIAVPVGLGTPGIFTSMTTGRVMSIAASEQGETALNYDITYYPTVDDETITTTTTTIQDLGGGISDAYRAEVTEDSPWGYWRLKETGGGDHLLADGATIGDETGNTNDMELHVTSGDKPHTLEIAIVNVGFLFGDTDNGGVGIKPNGTNARTDAPDSHQLKTKNVTLECWVKLVNTPSGENGAVLTLFDNNLNPTHGLVIGTGGHAIFKMKDHDGDIISVTSTTVLAEGTWYLIAGSIGPAGQRVYVNGVLEDHISPSPRFDYHGGMNAMLRGGYFDVLPYDVALAEPAVYGQQLANSRLAQHWTASQGGG